MNDNLWAGSTSTVTYTPKDSTGATYATEPPTKTATLKDDAGATVTLAGTPAWNTTLKAWVLNVSATECPATADGKKWTLTWVWTDANDVDSTQTQILVCTVLTGNLATLCTRQQVKDRLGITSADTSRDARIEALIASVLPAVKVRYGREFAPQVTATRTFRVDGYLVDLAPYDLKTATLVRLHPESATEVRTLAANGGYALGPVGGDAYTSTYTCLRIASAYSLASSLVEEFGYAQVEVTGTWGCWGDVTEVPGDINEAAIECVAAWLNRTSSATAGRDLNPREVAPLISTWDIPSSAHRKFQLYKRWAGVH